MSQIQASALGESLRAIKYVGKKETKTDNKCNTETVWNGPGDIQVVPTAIAAKLIEHPDIWRDVTDHVLKTIDKKPAKGQGAGPNPYAHLPRDKQLAQAIAQLDETTDFTNGGKPKTEALSRILNEPVSAAERDSAWLEVQEAREQMHQESGQEQR